MYKLLPIIAFIISLVALFLVWSDYHTKKVFDAAMLYEACVQKEYNTSPSQLYQEYGEYPYCDFYE